MSSSAASSPASVPGRRRAAPPPARARRTRRRRRVRSRRRRGRSAGRRARARARRRRARRSGARTPTSAAGVQHLGRIGQRDDVLDAVRSDPHAAQSGRRGRPASASAACRRSPSARSLTVDDREPQVSGTTQDGRGGATSRRRRALWVVGAFLVVDAMVGLTLVTLLPRLGAWSSTPRSARRRRGAPTRPRSSGVDGTGRLSGAAGQPGLPDRGRSAVGHARARRSRSCPTPRCLVPCASGSREVVSEAAAGGVPVVELARASRTGAPAHTVHRRGRRGRPASAARTADRSSCSGSSPTVPGPVGRTEQIRRHDDPDLRDRPPAPTRSPSAACCAPCSRARSASTAARPGSGLTADLGQHPRCVLARRSHRPARHGRLHLTRRRCGSPRRVRRRVGAVTDAIPHHPPVSDLADRLARAQAATPRQRGRRAAREPGPGPALPHRLRRAAARAAHLPGAARRRRAVGRRARAWSSRPRSASPIGELGIEIHAVGRDRRPVRPRGLAAARRGAAPRSTTTCGPRRCCRLRAAMPERRPDARRHGAARAAHAQDARRGRGAAPGRCGDRPRARAGCREWLRAGRTEREVGQGHRRRDPRRGPRARRLRHRGERAQRRQPAPRALRPRDRGRRPRRRRHRRHDARRLLLGRDAHLQRRRAARRVRRRTTTCCSRRSVAACEHVRPGRDAPRASTPPRAT